MPILNDFPARVVTTQLPHAGGPRTDKGSPPVASVATDYGTDDAQPQGYGHVLADHEARAGVDPVAELTYRRAVLAREAAPLRGLRDTFDAERKMVRGKVLARLNGERLVKGEKEIAASTAEMVASADPAYEQYLLRRRAEFARLAILEDEMDAITAALNRGQAILRYLTSEPHGGVGA